MHTPTPQNGRNRTGQIRSTDVRWRDEALALIAALEARLLVGEAYGHGAVRVRNPAGDPAPDDPVGQLMSPGLRQEVLCRFHGPDREPWWYWAWTGPERGSAPDLEPLCPIGEIETAADRIARVLAVPFDGAGS